LKGLHTACVAGDIVPYVVTLSAVCIQFAGTDRISTYLFMDYTPQVQHPIWSTTLCKCSLYTAGPNRSDPYFLCTKCVMDFIVPHTLWTSTLLQISHSTLLSDMLSYSMILNVAIYEVSPQVPTEVELGHSY